MKQRLPTRDTLARYWIGKWINEQPWADGFPWGTLVINVTGSFILGFAAVVILERLPPEYGNWYLVFGTGFCEIGRAHV